MNVRSCVPPVAVFGRRLRLAALSRPHFTPIRFKSRKTDEFDGIDIDMPLEPVDMKKLSIPLHTLDTIPADLLANLRAKDKTIVFAPVRRHGDTTRRLSRLRHHLGLQPLRRVLHLRPFHPNGAAVTLAETRRLADSLRRHTRFVIADDRWPLELAVEVTPCMERSAGQFRSAAEVATLVVDPILREDVQLAAHAGLAPTPVLAKMACEEGRRDDRNGLHGANDASHGTGWPAAARGIVSLHSYDLPTHEAIETFMRDVPVASVPVVGAAQARMLREVYGITKCRELLEQSERLHFSLAPETANFFFSVGCGLMRVAAEDTTTLLRKSSQLNFQALRRESQYGRVISDAQFLDVVRGVFDSVYRELLRFDCVCGRVALETRRTEPRVRWAIECAVDITPRTNDRDILRAKALELAEQFAPRRTAVWLDPFIVSIHFCDLRLYEDVCDESVTRKDGEGEKEEEEETKSKSRKSRRKVPNRVEEKTSRGITIVIFTRSRLAAMWRLCCATEDPPSAASLRSRPSRPLRPSWRPDTLPSTVLSMETCALRDGCLLRGADPPEGPLLALHIETNHAMIREAHPDPFSRPIRPPEGAAAPPPLHWRTVCASAVVPGAAEALSRLRRYGPFDTTATALAADAVYELHLDPLTPHAARPLDCGAAVNATCVDCWGPDAALVGLSSGDVCLVDWRDPRGGVRLRLAVPPRPRRHQPSAAGVMSCCAAGDGFRVVCGLGDALGTVAVADLRAAGTGQTDARKRPRPAREETARRALLGGRHASPTSYPVSDMRHAAGWVGLVDTGGTAAAVPLHALEGDGGDGEKRGNVWESRRAARSRSQRHTCAHRCDMAAEGRVLVSTRAGPWGMTLSAANGTGEAWDIKLEAAERLREGEELRAIACLGNTVCAWTERGSAVCFTVGEG